MGVITHTRRERLLLHCWASHYCTCLSRYPFKYEVATWLPAEDLDKPTPISTSVENDALNSFVYQTVGHNLLPYYATALNSTLTSYTDSRGGGSVNQDLSYKLEKEGEADDPHRLLEYIQKALLEYALGQFSQYISARGWKMCV